MAVQGPKITIMAPMLAVRGNDAIAGANIKEHTSIAMKNALRRIEQRTTRSNQTFLTSSSTFDRSGLEGITTSLSLTLSIIAGQKFFFLTKMKKMNGSG